MLNSNAKIVRKKLPWQELEEKIVILSPETRMSHELNETASWIWKELEHESSFKTLLTGLVEHFEVDDTVASADLAEVLKAMQDIALIEIHD